MAPVPAEQTAEAMRLGGKRYIGEREFCARFGVRPRTAQRWRAEGTGPAWSRLGPRRVAYDLAACEAWAASNTFRSRADELARAEAA